MVGLGCYEYEEAGQAKCDSDNIDYNHIFGQAFNTFASIPFGLISKFPSQHLHSFLFQTLKQGGGQRIGIESVKSTWSNVSVQKFYFTQ